MKFKQLQCCQLGGRKYTYSEILTLDEENKKNFNPFYKYDKLLAAGF
jgi:hypothetical protein